MEYLPKFVAMILTYNSGKTLRYTLDSLSSIADKIIIIDSGSTDETLDIVKEYNNVDIIIIPKKRDFSYFRNLALRKIGNGDYVLIVDSDEYLNPCLIDRLKRIKPLLKKNHHKYWLGYTKRLMPLLIGKKTYFYFEERRMFIFRKVKNMRYIGKVYEILIVNDKIFDEIAKKIEIPGIIIHSPRTADEYLRKRIERLDILFTNLFINGKRPLLKREKYLIKFPLPLATYLYGVFLGVNNLKSLFNHRKGDFIARLWLYICDIIGISLITLRMLKRKHYIETIQESL